MAKKSGGFADLIVMDLSKSYDCMPHKLLMAKFQCYGIDKGSLRLSLDYLSNRKQRTKMGLSFSSLCNINIGVAQGTIFGLFLFNILLTDFFFITKSEVCNLTDDNTLNTVMVKIKIICF